MSQQVQESRAIYYWNGSEWTDNPAGAKRRIVSEARTHVQIIDAVSEQYAIIDPDRGDWQTVGSLPLDEGPEAAGKVLYCSPSPEHENLVEVESPMLLPFDFIRELCPEARAADGRPLLAATAKFLAPSDYVATLEERANERGWVFKRKTPNVQNVARALGAALAPLKQADVQLRQLIADMAQAAEKEQPPPVNVASRAKGIVALCAQYKRYASQAAKTVQAAERLVTQDKALVYLAECNNRLKLWDERADAIKQQAESIYAQAVARLREEGVLQGLPGGLTPNEYLRQLCTPLCEQLVERGINAWLVDDGMEIRLPDGAVLHIGQRVELRGKLRNTNPINNDTNAAKETSDTTTNTAGTETWEVLDI